MQTFLPYANFQATARCLDYRRLGKQRVECLQIINVLSGKSSGWKNHPAVKMWRGYTDALKLYANHILHEWIERGYKNNMEYWDIPHPDVKYPKWLGNKDFHNRHKAALLFKEPSYYKQFGWDVKPEINYKWE